MKRLNKLYQFIFGPYPWKQFQFFLRLFVLTFLLYMMHRFGYAYERLTDRWFHYTQEIKASRQFSPLPLLPTRAVLPFSIFVFSTLIAYLIWYKQKYLIRLIFLISVYTQFVDQASAFTLNKYYTVFFLLAALSVTYEQHGKQWISAWPVRIMQMTFLIQYFTAGTCKVRHGDWSADTTDILRSQVQWLYCNDFAAYLLRILPRSAREIGEHLTLWFEIFAPILLLISYLHRKLVPLKWLVFIMGMWFHLFIAVSMKNLIYFSQQLMVMYVLFLSYSEYEWIIVQLKKISDRVREVFGRAFG